MSHLDSGLKYVTPHPEAAQVDLDDCFKEEIVPVGSIFCPYPAYGRPVRPEHVSNLTKGSPFDMSLTRIALSLRSDGRYACVDGNHTVERARKEGYTHVRARVYIDRNVAEEAMIFVAFDSQARISSVQNFMTRVAGGDEHAIRILRIVRERGFEISSKNRDGHTAAVSALTWIYETYSATLLADVLSIVRSAFCFDRHGLKAWALRGIAMFWRRYSTEVDRDRLVGMMADLKPSKPTADDTPAKTMLAYAMAHKAAHHGDDVDVAYGKQLRELYDKGRRHELPEWKSRAYSDVTLSTMSERGRKSHETRKARGENISDTVKAAIARKKRT